MDTREQKGSTYLHNRYLITTYKFWHQRHVQPKQALT